MANRPIAPIPQDKIGESFVWRDWFQKLNDTVYGTMAAQNAGNVNITGGTISNINFSGVAITKSTVDSTPIGNNAASTGRFTSIKLDTALAVAYGGTGVKTATANYVFAGPTAGAAAAPSFRALVVADIPALPYGTGDVVGPASATDNAVARFDLTTGKLIQNSVVTISDTGATTGITTLAASTSVTTPIVQASNSAGLLLKNASGTTQMSVGAGGGDNMSVNVSTNLNGTNAQIDISPTGTGHVHIKPTGTGSVEIAPTNVGTIDNMTIGATTPKNASVVDLSVTGTLSFDAAQGTAGQVLTSAGTGVTPTWTTPTTGTVTSVTGTAPVVSSGGSTPAISMAAATTSVSGYLTSTDWTTFNNKGSGTVTSVAALTLGTTGTDLTSTVATGTTTPVITLNVPTASASNRGVLSSADWTTFNGKGTGSVTSVSVVSANGFAGTVATSTTTPAITLTTSITGLLKGNGTAISAASSGTDYAPATSGTSILYGNGSGGFSDVTVGTGLSFLAGTLASTASTVSAPITKTADFTVGVGETWFINNKTGSACTVTLPSAATYTGRELTFKNMQAQLLNSATSNVVPIDSTSAGTAILLEVVGNWATLVSDGTNWVIMQAASNNNLLLE